MAKIPQSNMDNSKHLEALNANTSQWKISILALFLSVILHILLFLFVPDSEKKDGKKDDNQSLELEILPPVQELKAFPQYIEANPYANQEKPKDTSTKESFQDQRAADMIVDVNSDSDKPFVKGEMPDSQKIISADYKEAPSAMEAMAITEIVDRELNAPDVKEVLAEPTPNSSVESQVKKLQENSTTDKDFSGEASALKSEEDSAPSEGESTKISVKEGGESLLADVFAIDDMQEKGDIKIQEKDLKDFNEDESVSENISEKYSHKGDSQKDISTQQKQNKYEKQQEEKPRVLPTPKKRPSINMKITAGPLVDNDKRASEVGMVAVDSSFSEFGAYQQRMLEAISRQWNLLASQYNLSGIANTVVVIEFYLNSKGDLTSFKMPYSNSSDIGKTLCEQSIKSTAPYGAWTQDMIAVFGLNNQSVKITFHYR